MLTECVDFCRRMNIRYGAICETNTESQIIRISDTDKNLKIQGS